MAEPVEFGQTPLKAERKTVCHFRDQKAAGSNPATSTPRDIVNQCSRGFSFSVKFPVFSEKQPAGLQRAGKTPISASKKPLPVLSVNFRFFPL